MRIISSVMRIKSILFDREIVESMSPLDVLAEFLDRVLARDSDVCMVLVAEDGSETKLRYLHEKKWFELKSNLVSPDFPTVQANLKAFCKTSEIGWALLSFLRSTAQNVSIRVKSSKSAATELWLRKDELKQGQLEFFVRPVID